MHLSEKDNQQLLPIISRLSEKYVNGDTFPPHISVNSVARIELAEVKKAAIECIKGIPKIEVETSSIQYTDKWIKTLYIQIKENPDLIKISKRLDKIFRKDKSPYLLNPHVSLLYKDGMSTLEKRELVAKIKVPNKFLVSSIAVVTSENINDPKDYGAWKVVFEKELE